MSVTAAAAPAAAGGGEENTIQKTGERQRLVVWTNHACDHSSNLYMPIVDRGIYACAPAALATLTVYLCVYTYS